MALYAFIVPFLIPFNDPFLNLDLRAVILVIIGVICSPILIKDLVKGVSITIDKLTMRLLLLFFLILIVSTIFSINPLNSLIGGFGYRVGSLIISSLISIGYYLSSIDKDKVFNYLYVSTCACALLALILDYDIVLDGGRLIGSIYQSNVTAAYLGAGYLVGFDLINRVKGKWQLALYLAQVILFLTIFFTQSRFILFLVVIFSLFFLLQKVFNNRHFNVKSILLSSLIICAITFVAVGTGAHERYLNASLLGEGISYRIQLQSRGLEMLTQTPIYGWGLDSTVFIFDNQQFGELTDDIEHSYVVDKSFVDSTHNIFLDQFIQLGFIGGALFMFMMLRPIYSFMVNLYYTSEFNLFASIAPYVFILMQGLLNPTALEIELLLWCFFFINIKAYIKDRNFVKI